MRPLPSILVISAADPSGGAGEQADVRTAMLCGVHACVAVSALTIQNSQSFSAVYPAGAARLSEQIACIASDIEISAVKIGMLPDCEAVEAVAQALADYKFRNVVIDPIAGASLDAYGMKSREEVFAVAADNLYPLADVLTPNLPEGRRLLELKHTAVPDDIFGMAAALAKTIGCRAVLLKGGHGDGNSLTDIYFDRTTQECSLYVNPRIDSRNTHGTGCVLSTAIAAHLAAGQPVAAAIAKGVRMLRKLIAAGAGYTFGRGGYGPVGFTEYSDKP